MWQAIQKGWTPPRNVTEQKFNKLKHTPGDSAEKGYIGHQYGFNGHYFRSFAPNYGKHTNYSNVAAKLKHIGNEVADVTFRSGSYEQFSGLKNYIIYCDPPYESTTQHYKAVQSGFNSEDFYKWCRRMAEHNIVLISGYSAPRDFVSIHSSARLLTGYHSYSKGEKSKSKSKSKTGYRSRSHLSRGDYSHKKAKRIEHVYWVK
jgi:DNA adenine methylase